LPRTKLYLSPHLDDAVLSCGGLIHRQVTRGNHVVVATVFAAVPGTLPDSYVVRELHGRWAAGENPVSVRQSEDEAALERLGAESARLDYVDCIYRVGPDGRPFYVTSSDLFGPVRPEDPVHAGGLAGEIMRLIGSLCAGRVYAPLAAGHHVDHQIVRAAAAILEQEGVPVAFYEDYPYAREAGAVEQALGDRAAWRPRTAHISVDDLAAQIEAIAQYRSQISSFWDDSADMAHSVREYAVTVGRGRPGERYWRRLGHGV
jgi:LmbE family N-acetylglucosaminyl deacetylase